MLPVFAVIHVLLSAALVGLILMHSGRDSGLGGMGFTPQSQGGTHIVERNLTRLTLRDRHPLLPEHGAALPAAPVVLHSRLCSWPGSTTSRVSARTRSRRSTSTVTSSASRWSRRRSTSTTRTATTSTSATRAARRERCSRSSSGRARRPGVLGRGTLESDRLATPSVTMETELLDPDGLRLRLLPAPSPALREVAVDRQPGSVCRPVRARRAAPFRRPARGARR